MGGGGGAGGGGGGGGGGRGAIGWVGYGRGPIGAYIARRRTTQQMYEAVEADMADRGLPIPPRPMSQEKIFGIGFLCGLLLGLLIGLIFWELT
jgi:hypothetical protein